MKPMTPHRVIAHIDMNSFFVSCERLVDPTLVGKPVVVGGARNARGVVASASYEARAYGVHSAMPLREAAKKCPQAVFLPGNHGLYSKYSRKVYALLMKTAPRVEYASIDEFYLDLTGCEALFGTDEAGMARSIRQSVMDRTGLACTVAVASNKYTAKIAGKTVKPNLQKPLPPGAGEISNSKLKIENSSTPGISKGERDPEGIIVVPEGKEAEFLARLPIEALHGAGEKTQPHLKDLGVRTIGDLAGIPLQRLKDRFGEAGGEWLYEACRGIDDSPVETEHEAKSVGHENTFDVDTDDAALLERTLSWLAEKSAFRLRRLGRKACTVTLKLRYRGFETLTRAKSVPPTCEDYVIARTALALFREHWDRGRQVRLVGVSLSKFDEAGEQGDWLFPEMGDNKREALTKAADSVKRRFGMKKIRRAASLEAGESGHLPETTE